MRAVRPTGRLRLRVPRFALDRIPAVRALESKAHCLPFIRVRALNTERGVLNVTLSLSSAYGGDI